MRQLSGRFSNLGIRTLSAFMLAPPILWCIYMGGLWFTSLLLLAAWLMTREWHELTAAPVAGNPGKSQANTPQDIWYLRVIIGIALALAASGQIMLAWVPLLAGLLLRMFHHRLGAQRNNAVLIGLFYIAIPLIAMLAIRDMPVQGAAWMFWLIGVVWATDIGGYFVGKHFGGPKLAPTISPGKTWSGFIGATLCAAMLGGTIAFVMEGYALRLALLAAIVAVVAQIGDLYESRVKRMFGKKDSGALIPGHGGIFDRVDGLLAAAVALWFVLSISGGMHCALGGVGCL